MLAVEDGYLARVMTAWPVTRQVCQPAVVLAGGLVGTLLSMRVAMAVGGAIVLLTVVLLPRRASADAPPPT